MGIPGSRADQQPRDLSEHRRHPTTAREQFACQKHRPAWGTISTQKTPSGATRRR